MQSEIQGHMPIGMLASLVVTVAYRPEYDTDKVYADDIPNPITVVVPEMYIDKFVEEARFNLGLEEYEDFASEELDTLDKFIETYKGYCPFIVNAMFVDFMGKVLVIEDLEATCNFPSAASFR